MHAYYSIAFPMSYETPRQRVSLWKSLGLNSSEFGLRSRTLAQSRKGAKRYRVSNGSLCAFATLREKNVLHRGRQMNAQSRVADMAHLRSGSCGLSHRESLNSVGSQ